MPARVIVVIAADGTVDVYAAPLRGGAAEALAAAVEAAHPGASASTHILLPVADLRALRDDPSV